MHHELHLGLVVRGSQLLVAHSTNSCSRNLNVALTHPMPLGTLGLLYRIAAVDGSGDVATEKALFVQFLVARFVRVRERAVAF